ncbi:MAG: L,D-transpeptidase family protein [Chloroflexi bacterium]|nr:L,D-transpeptidase family protein [Chloroflexota bacterium]
MAHQQPIRLTVLVLTLTVCALLIAACGSSDARDGVLPTRVTLVAQGNNPTPTTGNAAILQSPDPVSSVDTVTTPTLSDSVPEPDRAAQQAAPVAVEMVQAAPDLSDAETQIAGTTVALQTGESLPSPTQTDALTPLPTASPTLTPTTAPPAVQMVSAQNTATATTFPTLTAAPTLTLDSISIQQTQIAGTLQALESSRTPTPSPTATLSGPPGQTYEIVFYTDRSGNDDIYLLTTIGEERPVLTSLANEREPSCAPGGGSMVFASDADDGRFQIWRLDFGSEEPVQLTTADGQSFAPVFSPDGSTIAFASTRVGGIATIWLMNPDGSNQRQLTVEIGRDTSPAWGPDGAQLLFASDQFGEWDIFTTFVDGEGELPLPPEFSAGNQLWPAFDSTGERIVYSVWGALDDPQTTDSFVIDFEQLEPQVVRSGPGADIAWSWFDDERLLASVGGPDDVQIALVDVSTGEATPLTSVGPFNGGARPCQVNPAILPPEPTPIATETPTPTLTPTPNGPTVTPTLTPTPTSNAPVAVAMLTPTPPSPPTSTPLPPTPTITPTVVVPPAPAFTPTPTLSPPATLTPTLPPTMTPTPTTTPTSRYTVMSYELPPELLAYQGRTHIVRRGETVGWIAQRYGVYPAELAELNGLDNINVLEVGQALVIPVTRTGISQSGYQLPDSDRTGEVAARKEIVVNLTTQRVYAYENGRLVRSILSSTGQTLTPTVEGSFEIYLKLEIQDMSGPGYYVPDVPYVMYFYTDYSFHGVYWHDNFGQPMSHGCVNLPTPEARWLYDWADIGTPVLVYRGPSETDQAQMSMLP